MGLPARSLFLIVFICITLTSTHQLNIASRTQRQRRAFIRDCLVVLAAPSLAIADESSSIPTHLKFAVFSGGDPRFLKAAFEAKRTSNFIETSEVGFVGDARAIKLGYDPSKSSYKKLLGVYWRSINPVDGGGQFKERGSAFRPLIYAANEMEKEQAETSRRMIALSGVYDPKRGVSRRPVELQVPIELGVVSFIADEEQDTGFENFEKEYKVSGRAKFFEDQVKQV